MIILETAMSMRIFLSPCRNIFLAACFVVALMTSAYSPATPPNKSDDDLLRAVARGEFDAARRLIEQGANASAADQRGSTVLYYAAGRPSKKALDFIKLLVEHGAAVNTRGIGGFTPLHNACDSGRPETVAYLLSKGADVNARENTRNDTPLMVTVRSSTAVNRVEIIKILLANKADVNAINLDGKAPLDIARDKKLYATEKALVDAGGKSGRVLHRD